MVALAGCSALSGGDQPAVDDSVGDDVEIEHNATGATNVTQSISVEVDETVAGEELTDVGATYPRDRFVVRSAQHDEIALGVDTDEDGEAEQTFNQSHVSGANNNEFSFDIALDTDYTLQSGDVVTVEYPGIDNPSEPGEYDVEVSLNDRQTENVTVAVE